MTVDPREAMAQERTLIVASVVERLYAKHPEWETRWGPEGREACARDVGFSYSFLEASLRAEDASIFESYAKWLANLLAARGVPPASIEASFALIEDEVTTRIPSIARAAASHLASARAALRAANPSEPSGPTPGSWAANFLDAILAPDRPRAEAVLREALARGLKLSGLADQVIQPAMEEVGARWARNEISVAEEHLATAIAQSVLARIASPSPASRGRGRAVFACVEGNLHSLGARVAADAFEEAGWSVEFLGADVPTRDLVSYLRAHPVDLVGLSIALPQQLSSAQRTIAALRRALGDACPRIAVGGIPIRDFRRMAHVIGADVVFPSVAAGLPADE